jgi:hypothetical protein
MTLSRVPIMSDESRQEIVRLFEQEVLPTAAFQNHPQLLATLRGDGPEGPPFQPFWAKSISEGIRDGKLPGGMDAVREMMDAITPLMEQVLFPPYPFDGYTVHGIKTPDMEGAPHSICLAIVHRDGEMLSGGMPSPSTRFFSLEADASGNFTLCQRMTNGTHQNLGDCDVGTLEEFAALACEKTKGEPLPEG